MRYLQRFTFLILSSSLIASSAFAFRSSVGFWKPSQFVDYISNLFNQGTSTGTTWDTPNKYLRLDQSGTPVNNSGFDSSWTPEWASIVGVWHLDETSGNIADSSGNGHTGTQTGTVTMGAAGKLKNALSFNGSGGISHFGVGTFDPTNGGNSLSVSFWFNWAGTNGYYQCPVTKRAAYSSTTVSWQIAAANNSSAVAFGTTSGSAATVPLTSDGAWHHYVASQNGATIVQYLDGVAKTSDPALTFAAAASGTPVQIGDCNTDSNFNGSLDEVAIWSTGLTPAEVATIYSRQSAKYAGTFTSRVIDGLAAAANWTSFTWSPTLPFLKELPDGGSSESSSVYPSQSASLMSGIQGLWHLDEATGASTTIDNSGNGNTGTPGGAATFGAAGRLGNSVALDGSSGYIQTTYTQTAVTAYTVSSWIKTTSPGASSGNPAIFDDRGTDGAKSLTLFLGKDPLSCGMAGGIGWELNSASTAIGIESTVAVNDGSWHHVVATWSAPNGTTIDPSQFSLYIDGQLNSATVCSYGSGQISPLSGQGGAQIGHNIRNGGYLSANLDEVAVWSRALSSAEVLELYRRGANRIKYQMRTCAAADCSDDVGNTHWKGPDNTNQTYFSELNNNAVPNDGGDLSGSDSVKTTLPKLMFSNFSSLAIPSQRYFQYRAIMESDDPGSGCNYGSGATWCSPELQSAAVSP